MATRSVNNKVLHKKKTHMATKMGKRCVEVRPVNAWVQAEPVVNTNYQEATVLAQIEDLKLRAVQQEKIERLKKFQEDVKHRVQALARAKQQKQTQKSCRDVEIEQNIVNQSAFAAEKSTPRKDRCTLRNDRSLSIQHSPRLQPNACIDSDASDHENHRRFEEQNIKVHKISRQARRSLVSRKIMESNDVTFEDLPGGVWHEGPTRDHPVSRHPTNPVIVDLEDAEENEERRNAQNIHDVEYDGKKYVQFDDEVTSDLPRPEASKTLTIATSVPDIYPGIQTQEEKKRVCLQRALFRRLFMDIEREQVKENQRRKDHRKRIHQLKKEKEEERQRVEQQAQRLVEPRDPLTGVSQLDMERQKQQEERMVKGMLQERQKREQKHRETERYLEALKRNLMEKIDKQNVTLPALCCCGPSVWDTNPDTCANNCVFYKNHREMKVIASKKNPENVCSLDLKTTFGQMIYPEAYAKALQSLLVSCDVV